MNLPETMTNAQSWTLVGPLGPALPSFLAKNQLLAVDGGAQFTSHIDLWVGDQDSLLIEPISPLIVKLSPHKDASDLAHALKILQNVKANHFSLWGFLGGRMDHELFNLGECLRFLTSRADNVIDFYNTQGKIQLKLFGKGQRELTHHGLFSVGCMTPSEVILTGECQFPINQLTTLAPFSSFGLSNVAHGKFKLRNEGPVFVILSEEP